METSSPDFVQALGGGSGIDTKAISKALAEAQITPRQTRVEQKIDTLERRNSGLSALSLALTNLKESFDSLKDKSTFAGVSGSNSHPEAFQATVGAGADSGSHDLKVNTLATSQRRVSAAFASSDTALNSGGAMTLNFVFNHGGTEAVSVSAAQSTPAGVVEEINSADIGVTALLVDTGDATNQYQILLVGEEGADNGFTVTTDDSANPGTAVADLSFDTSLQAAADAEVEYQGIVVSRGANTIDDLVPGVVLQLLNATPVGESARLTLSRDVSSVKNRILELVAQYNQTMDDIDVLGGERSDDKEDVYSGSLQGESLLNRVKSQLRSLLVDESSSPSGGLTAFWQLGLSISRTGVASVNEATLDNVLQTSFEDVRKLFSADTDDQSPYSSAAAGIAGDASKDLLNLISYRGSLATSERFNDQQLSTLELKLEDLKEKLEDIEQRYLRQFARMEEMVSAANSKRGGIVSSIGSKN